LKKRSLHSEKELVQELKNGSVLAFEELYSLYSLRLYHFGLKYLKSEIESEGLVQEVFAKIWERRKCLKPELSFKSYIFTITFNFIKKNLIKSSQLRDFLNSDIKHEEIDFETVNQVEYQSLMDYLNTLIDQLPEKRKAVFIKRRIEDLPVKEVARQLNISPKTVENQLTSATKFIKENWKNEFLSAAVLFDWYFSKYF
jgi:RNA polymerase sigma-70 factor (ECF subfamily)